jgi:hypothetical protein
VRSFVLAAVEVMPGTICCPLAITERTASVTTPRGCQRTVYRCSLYGGRLAVQRITAAVKASQRNTMVVPPDRGYCGGAPTARQIVHVPFQRTFPVSWPVATGVCAMYRMVTERDRVLGMTPMSSEGHSYGSCRVEAGAAFALLRVWSVVRMALPRS